MSNEIRPMTAFILVSSGGYAIPISTNYTANQVRIWADNNFHNGGYELAKKEGWRVRKILIIDAKTEGR